MKELESSLNKILEEHQHESGRLSAHKEMEERRKGDRTESDYFVVRAQAYTGVPDKVDGCEIQQQARCDPESRGCEEWKMG